MVMLFLRVSSIVHLRYGSKGCTSAAAFAWLSKASEMQWWWPTCMGAAQSKWAQAQTQDQK